MSIKTSQELKQLQSRKAKLEVDLKVSGGDLALINNAHTSILNQLAAVKAQIEKLTSGDLVISEHAILRYLERTNLIDLELVKKQILSDEAAAAIQKMGNGKYPIGNGLRVVVKGNTVVSIT